MVHAIVGIAFVAVVAYGAYKHTTLAQVKAEVAKIENEILTGAVAAEAKVVYTAVVARIKAIL